MFLFDTAVVGRRPASCVRRSRGLSLIEVLISIFVLAVGLLGVASLLPVGQQQVQRGAMYQRAVDLSNKAFGMIEAHSMNSPARWVDSATGNMDAAVNPFNGSRLALKLNPAGPHTSSSLTVAALPNRLNVVADQVGSYLQFIRGPLRGSRRRISSDVSAGSLVTWPTAVATSLAGDTNSVFVCYRSQAFALDPYYASVHGNGTDPFALGMRRVTLLGAVDVVQVPLRGSIGHRLKSCSSVPTKKSTTFRPTQP